jgi:hypothetical protein
VSTVASSRENVRPDSPRSRIRKTVRAPLSAFLGANGHALDPQKLVAVRLRFDRTATSVICISGIGFGSE